MVTNIPPSAMTVIESNQRFHATMKPANSLKREFGPLVNAAFERHDAAQVNHDRGLWNVEEQNRQ